MSVFYNIPFNHDGRKLRVRFWLPFNSESFIDINLSEMLFYFLNIWDIWILLTHYPKYWMNDNIHKIYIRNLYIEKLLWKKVVLLPENQYMHDLTHKLMRCHLCFKEEFFDMMRQNNKVTSFYFDCLSLLRFHCSTYS